MKPAVYAIATMDTKGDEIAFVAKAIRASGSTVVVVDVGTAAPPTQAPDVDRATVADYHPDGRNAVLGSTDRGAAVTRMSEALVGYLSRECAAGKIAGVVGVGGSGGSAIIAPAMQALPVGLPKLLVSTLASGNVRPYVGCTDITMMYPVVDVAGINRVSRQILANAAGAIVGMVNAIVEEADRKPTVAMTMFGVTTPCVTRVRQLLEAKGFDCLVFHATGSGGQAMEKLVASGMIDGVLDITTTEAADEIAGGILSAGPNRFEAIAASGLPCVVSVGACDMVNFGAQDTIPERYRDRKFHVHNAQVTLMRTTPDENRAIGQFIGGKYRNAKGPVSVLIPEAGVSALDAPNSAFFDPEADAILFETLADSLTDSAHCSICRLPLHINDPAFADALTAEFLMMFANRKESKHAE